MRKPNRNCVEAFVKMTRDELELLFKMTIEYLKDTRIEEIIRLLIFMKKWGIKDVSFDAKDDLYFKIWHQDRQFTEEFLEKPHYTLGSLADDITGLRRLLDDEEFPATLDVERMGAILTALGATMLEKADLSEK